MKKDEEPIPMGKRTKAFALKIIGLSARIPRSREGDVIGNQLLRSGTSIGANFAEADNSRSKAEFIAKAGDALREAAETIYWLELLRESEFFAVDVDGLRLEACELKAILASMIRNSRSS